MGKFYGLDSLVGLFAHHRGGVQKDWPNLEVDDQNNLHVAISAFSSVVGKLYSEVITLQDAVSASGNGNVLNCEGLATIGLQISGTFTATVYFEGTINGTDWVEILGINQNDGSAATSTSNTVSTLWIIPVSSIRNFRARVAWTGGTSITITAVGSIGPSLHVLPVAG